jgi:hypothetical protein
VLGCEMLQCPTLSSDSGASETSPVQNYSFKLKNAGLINSLNPRHRGGHSNHPREVGHCSMPRADSYGMSSFSTYKTSMLPSNPLLRSAHIILVRKAELVIWVAMSREIRQDRSALKDGKLIAVVVDNCRNLPIRRVLGKPWLLLNILYNVDALVGVVLAINFLQLLEQNRSFMAIRSAESEKLDAGFGNQACGTS